MQIILIVLRLTHIVAGAFWVGSALMLALVILPGVRKSGPGAERALPLAKISQAMGLGSLLTVVAGLLLYWLVYRFAWAWISSPVGIGFTLGSLAGIAAFLLGAFSTGPTSKKMAALGAQMQAAGGPPTPEQVAEMGRLQAKLASSSQWGTILATVALALMAVARSL
mgnify:FL=1|jgi:hypothetical protein